MALRFSAVARYFIPFLPLQLRNIFILRTEKYVTKTYFMYHQLQNSEILFSGHNVFACSVWISEQTTIISLYSINLIGFYNQGRKWSLRGTYWAFKRDRKNFVLKGLIPILKLYCITVSHLFVT